MILKVSLNSGVEDYLAIRDVYMPIYTCGYPDPYILKTMWKIIFRFTMMKDYQALKLAKIV